MAMTRRRWRGVVLACMVIALSGCAAPGGKGAAPQEIPGVTREPTTRRAIGPSRQVMLGAPDKMITRQISPVWCWAACVEMIYRHEGKAITQKQIVEQIAGLDDEGHPKRTRASTADVLCALDLRIFKWVNGKGSGPSSFDRQWTMDQDLKSNSRQPTSRGIPRPELRFDPDVLIADMVEDRPVIVGLGGNEAQDSEHMIVIYGVVFEPIEPPRTESERADAYQILEVHYLDPDGGTKAAMSGQELERRGEFFATRKRAKEYYKYIVAHQRDLNRR